MKRLCSFLMPTRSANHTSLCKAVRSIFENGNSEDCEVLLRMDDDDTGRHHIAKGLEAIYPSVRSVIGPRGRGYNDMGVFVQDLVNIADSEWCWLFDDDAWVEGNWYEPLKATKGHAANAQMYVLGESWYPNDANGGAPGLIMPTAWCKTHKHSNPVDQTWLDEVHRNNWKIQQLAGVFYFHDGRLRV